MRERRRGPLSELWPRLDADLERWLAPPSRALPAVRFGGEALASLLAPAEAALGAAWPSLPASAWSRFHGDGDRQDYETRLFARAARLSRAALLAAGAGDRWLDEVGDGVIAVCEQSSWCWPAHDDAWERSGEVLPDPDRPFLDLGAGEVAAQLAWIDHLVGDRLERRLPGLGRRLRREVARRVFEPFESRADWHWLGLDQPIHNWAPWIAGNLLTAALRLGEDGPARRRLVAGAVAVLDRYAAALPPDGACDEGQGYWWNGPARLLEALALLRHATGGRLDGAGQARLRRTVGFPANCHLGGPWYVNHADASAQPGADQPWHTLWRLGALVGDPGAQALALEQRPAGGPERHAWPAPPADSLGRLALALSDEVWWRLGRPAGTAAGPGGGGVGEGSARPAARQAGRRTGGPAARTGAPLPAWVWYPSTEVMVAREQGGRAAGLAVVAKGGHNGEPHNHNDVGSVIVALDGTPALVDPGRPTYTAQTFGPGRYEIWCMQSQWHNLPVIAGQGQAVGRDHGARGAAAALDGRAAVFEAELAGAYQVSALASWRRRVELDLAAPAVRIADAWRWRSAAAPVELRLLVAGRIGPVEAGRLAVQTLAGGWMSLAWPEAIGFELVERTLDDPALRRVWGPRLTQLRLDATGLAACEVVCQRLPELNHSKTNKSALERR
jgi:hypothetical protein